MKKDTENKLKVLAEIVYYGSEWLDDGNPPDDPGVIFYKSGGEETIAHQVACYFVQNFGEEYPEVNEGVETGFTRDFLDLSKRKTKKQIFEKLKSFLQKFK